MRQIALLTLGILFLQLCPAYAATIISTNITASGSGNTADETLANDTELTGNVLAEDNGVVTIDIHDTSGISGTLTADRDGLINLSIADSGFVSGALTVGNGGDAEIDMSGGSLFSGSITVSNSGGYLNLTMNDNASLTGHLSGGSHSTTTVILTDSASMTGGVEADDGGVVGITMSGDTALSGGMRAIGTGQLAITASGDAAIDGDLAVNGGSSATLDLGGNTTYTGDMAIDGSGTLNLTASNNTVLTGDLETSGGGRATVILNDDTTMTGNVDTNSGGNTTITLNDSTSLTGDAYTGAGAPFTLALNDNATFRGASASDWGNVDISLNGANTAWYVTQSTRVSAANGATGSQYASYATNLTLADGAWVYLGAQNYTVNSAADRVQLDVNTLSGNGNFELRPHVTGIGSAAYNDGDLIHVTNNSGSHSIYVPSTQLGLGGVSVNGQEILKVVHSIDGGGQFSLYQNKLVDIGHLSYKLIQQNNHWYLVVGNAEGDGNTTDPDPVDPLPPGGIIDPNFGINVDPDGVPLNRPAETAANFMTANYLITYMEQQTLMQRMGELRECRQGDVWLRGFAGGMNSKRFGPLDSYSMRYYGLQIGADRKISAISENFFMGVMAGYTRGDPKHSNSDSDIESYQAGLYGLYGTEDDFYIDATARISHVRNKYTTVASDGYAVRAKGSGNAYTVGLEMGKRFYFNELRKGFYVEPQVQGIYTHQEKIALNADNGLLSRMDGYNSVLVRAGGAIGYKVREGAVPVNAYVKGAYVRELTADVGVHYNQVRYRDYSYKGGWYDVGVGVTTQFRDRHNLYLDLEYASGKRFNKRQVNLGYRLSF